MSELKLPEINRVLISGRLTRDPDKRYAQDGTPVTSFDLAFHRRFRNRDGSLGEQTGFVTVFTYQRLAEVCGEYLKKGSPVLIEGRLQFREWKNEKGERRTRLELRADMAHFLERRPEGSQPELDVVHEEPARAAAPAPRKGSGSRRARPKADDELF
jgi:single-strand DNA-binding protein